MVSVPGKQCIAVHICYLASNAYLYDLVLGKQGILVRVCRFSSGTVIASVTGEQCTDGRFQDLASSVPIRIGTTFTKSGLLG